MNTCDMLRNHFAVVLSSFIKHNIHSIFDPVRPTNNNQRFAHLDMKEAKPEEKAPEQKNNRFSGIEVD